MFPLIFFCIIICVSSKILGFPSNEGEMKLKSFKFNENEFGKFCNIEDKRFLPTKFRTLGAFVIDASNIMLILVPSEQESIVLASIFSFSDEHFLELDQTSPWDVLKLNQIYKLRMNMNETLHIMQFYEYLFLFPKELYIEELIDETAYVNQTFIFRYNKKDLFKPTKINAAQAKSLAQFFKKLNANGRIIDLFTASRKYDNKILLDIKITTMFTNDSTAGNSDNTTYCLSGIFSFTGVEIGEPVINCKLNIEDINAAVWYKADKKNNYYHGLLFNNYFAIPIVSKIDSNLDRKSIKQMTSTYTSYDETETPGVNIITYIPISYLAGCPTSMCNLGLINCAFTSNVLNSTLLLSGRTLHIISEEGKLKETLLWKGINYPQACFSINDKNTTVIFKNKTITLMSTTTKKENKVIKLDAAINFKEPIDAAFYLENYAYIFSGEKIFQFKVELDKNLSLIEPKSKFIFSINHELPINVDAAFLITFKNQHNLYIYKKEYFYKLSFGLTENFWQRDGISIEKKGVFIEHYTSCKNDYYFNGEELYVTHLQKIKKYPPQLVTPVIKKQEPYNIYTFKNISLMILAVIAGFLFVYLITNLIEKKFIKKAPPELSHLSTLSGISKI